MGRDTPKDREKVKDSVLPNCWEIMKCGRATDEPKVAELGECIASKEEMGHSCWAIAGTLCGGVVQGTSAQKEGTCLRCQVYAEYNRMSGTKREDVKQAFSGEEEKHTELLRKQLRTIHCNLWRRSE